MLRFVCLASDPPDRSGDLSSLRCREEEGAAEVEGESSGRFKPLRHQGVEGGGRVANEVKR